MHGEHERLERASVSVMVERPGRAVEPPAPERPIHVPAADKQGPAVMVGQY
jgi:hypothetical protein